MPIVSGDASRPGDELGATFRARLNELFAQHKAEGRAPMNNKQLAQWLREHGYPSAESYLSDVRRGREQPTLRLIEGVARAFDVDSAQLISKTDTRAHLGQILSDPAVQGVALRASRLTPEALSAIQAIMDQMLDRKTQQ